MIQTLLPAAKKIEGAKEAGVIHPLGWQEGAAHRRPCFPGSPGPPLQLLQKWLPAFSIKEHLPHWG